MHPLAAAVTALALAILLAALQVSGQYGPPPTKGKKHRTTTTTTEGPGASDNEITGPIQIPSGPGSGPGSGSTSYAFSSSSTSSNVPGSTVVTGGSYWWQGDNSPFRPGSAPAGSVPPSPSSPPSPPPPVHGGCGGPAGCTGVGTDPRPSPAEQPSKPVDIAQNPFLSSALLGKPIPGQPTGQPSGQYPSQPSSQYPGQPTGQPSGQYPGQPTGQPSGQYPGQPTGQPSSQYPGQPTGQPSGQYPGQPTGQPSGQYPGQPSGQYPGQPTGQPSGQYPGQPTGKPFGQYPGQPTGQPSGQYPGQPSGQYPALPTSQPSGQYPGQPTVQPSGQYPGQPTAQPSGQYPGQPTGQPSGQYPGQPTGQPSGQYPGQPSGQYPAQPYGQSGPESQAPVPLRPKCTSPGTACVPSSSCVGGVISPLGMQQMRDPQIKECIPGLEACCRLPGGSTPTPGNGYGVTQRPYSGPLNTTPYPGCAAALKCVAETYCSAEGVMVNTPVLLTREQADNRVPLTDCQDLETGIIGKCCRDPNYKDPWPAGMMMKNTGDFDDGQYHGEGSGPSYNSISSTPQTPSKDHGPKPSDRPGGFDKPFPPPFPGNSPNNPGYTPGKPQPTGVYQPSPSPYQPNQPTGSPYQPGKPSGSPYQPNQPAQPTGSPYQPGKPSGSPYQPNQPSQPTGSPYQPNQPGQPSGSPYQPNQPGQPSGSPYQPGQPTGSPYKPSPSGNYQPGKPSGTPYQPSGTPNQPGQHSPPGTYQPGQPSPTGTSYQPGQPSPTGTYQPGQPSPTGTSYQPGQPSPTGTYQPGQPSPTGTSYQPGQPSPTGTYQPGQPSPTGTSYQPGQPIPTFPSQGTDFPGQESQFPEQVPDFTLPTHPGQHQPSGGPAPGTSCGIRRPVPGPSGDVAGFAEFPWQAIVTAAGNRSMLCGAAIIADNAVVTAAHCVQHLQSKDLLVRAGEWKLLGQNPRPVQVRPVAAIARHPGYNSATLAKDLAILVLSQPLTLDQHVDTICIPSALGAEYSQRPGQNCVLTGWGKNALKEPIQNSDLHKIDVNVIPAKQCEEKLKNTQNLGKYFILNEGFSCALPPNPTDLCKVDYGSAVACERGDGHYELAGVNSWDLACPTQQPLPTVFATSDGEWMTTVLGTPLPVLQAQEGSYDLSLLQGEDVGGVDIDDKPGFSQGYGK